LRTWIKELLIDNSNVVKGQRINIMNKINARKLVISISGINCAVDDISL
jgi:hypothetical protein